MDQSYGNINNSRIKEIIENSKFQDIWFINKDKIEGCRDCEYRYICLDGRIPVIDNDKWIYRDKCGYNPYNATWEDENNTIQNKVEFA